MTLVLSTCSHASCDFANVIATDALAISCYRRKHRRNTSKAYRQIYEHDTAICGGLSRTSPSDCRWSKTDRRRRLPEGVRGDVPDFNAAGWPGETRWHDFHARLINTYLHSDS